MPRSPSSAARSAKPAKVGTNAVIREYLERQQAGMRRALESLRRVAGRDESGSCIANIAYYRHAMRWIDGALARLAQGVATKPGKEATSGTTGSSST